MGARGGASLDGARRVAPRGSARRRVGGALPGRFSAGPSRPGRSSLARVSRRLVGGTRCLAGGSPPLGEGYRHPWSDRRRSPARFRRYPIGVAVSVVGGMTESAGGIAFPLRGIAIPERATKIPRAPSPVPHSGSRLRRRGNDRERRGIASARWGIAFPRRGKKIPAASVLARVRVAASVVGVTTESAGRSPPSIEDRLRRGTHDDPPRASVLTQFGSSSPSSSERRRARRDRDPDGGIVFPTKRPPKARVLRR